MFLYKDDENDKWQRKNIHVVLPSDGQSQRSCLKIFCKEWPRFNPTIWFGDGRRTVRLNFLTYLEISGILS